MQEDVDMVNSLVEVIESTRSKHTPKIGDRVVYTQKGGEYHPHGLMEKKHEDKFYVCLDPFIPFVWESDTAIKVDVSGGPFYHADADKFKFIGWNEADFKEWGHCGATANGTVRFKAKVPLWAYSEPDSLFGDFTGKGTVELPKLDCKGKKPDVFKHPECAAHKAIRQALGGAYFSFHNSQRLQGKMVLGEDSYGHSGDKYFWPLSYSSAKTAQKRMDKLEKAGIRCKLTGYNGGCIEFLGYTPETEALLEKERQ